MLRSDVFSLNIRPLLFDLGGYLQLTDSWNHSSDEIKSPREIPPRSGGVHADSRHIGLLIVPQEVLEVVLTQIVLVGELLDPLSPSLFGELLLRMLERRKHRCPTQQVDDDQQSQHEKSGIVFI